MLEASAADNHARAARRPVDLAWASIVFLVPMFLTLQSRLGTVDLTYHLRAGETILSTHMIPSTDTYTFTIPGAPWLDQQWGAQAVLAGAYRIGGFDLLYLLRALLAAVTFCIVYLGCRARGAPPRTSSILSLLGFLVCIPTLALRPQLLTMPLFALAMWALASRETHLRRVWLIPILTILAANLHGSFVLFPGIAGLAFLEDLRRRAPSLRTMLLVTLVTAACTLVNPFGFGVWTYAYDLSTNPVIRDTISEWAPVTLPNVIGVFTLGSMFAVALVLARRRPPAPLFDLLWLAIFAALALVAIRGIVWWTIVTPIVLARSFAAATAPARAQERRMPAFVMIGVLAVATCLFLPWIRPGGVPLDEPEGLTKAIGYLPRGTKIFAYQPWASWFEFVYPGDPVYSDSRIEIFPRQIWKDYSQVAFAGAGWRAVLDRWQPDAIVAKSSWDLIPYLKADPAWTLVHQDKDGLLFVRS